MYLKQRIVGTFPFLSHCFFKVSGFWSEFVTFWKKQEGVVAGLVSWGCQGSGWGDSAVSLGIGGLGTQSQALFVIYSCVTLNKSCLLWGHGEGQQEAAVNVDNEQWWSLTMRNELMGVHRGMSGYPMKAWHPHISRRDLNKCMIDRICSVPLDTGYLTNPCLGDCLTSWQ